MELLRSLVSARKNEFRSLRQLRFRCRAGVRTDFLGSNDPVAVVGHAARRKIGRRSDERILPLCRTCSLQQLNALSAAPTSSQFGLPSRREPDTQPERDRPDLAIFEEVSAQIDDFFDPLAGRGLELLPSERRELTHGIVERVLRVLKSEQHC